MPYLNPDRVRFARLGDVKGPALLIPHDRPDDLLFVGCGNDPLVCFLGGGWKGEGFRQRVAENWEGIAIENVQLKVDISSTTSPDIEGKRILSAVRSGTNLGLFIRHKENQFTQTIICEAANELPPGSADTRIGFKRWKLIVREGDDEIEVFALDLDEDKSSEEGQAS